MFTRVLLTPSKHGTVFRCDREGTNDAEELVVSARLPARVADFALSQLELAISNGVRMQFIVEILSHHVPAWDVLLQQQQPNQFPRVLEQRSGVSHGVDGAPSLLA